MVVRLFFVIFSLLSLSSTLAFANSLIDTNSISKNERGHYLIGANDPYFVFDHSSGGKDNTNRHWLLPLTLVSQTKKNQRIDVEVFFDGKYANNRRVFSPRKYLKFSVESQDWRESSGLNITLPTDVRFSDNSLLRVDLNGCTKCEVSLNAAPRLNAEPSSNYANTKLLQQRNGLNTPEQLIINIPVEQWSRNNIDDQGILTGQDPFMVSPALDTNTNKLAGIYFEVSSKINDAVSNSSKHTERAVFQLFYATETHGFIEAASSYARISPHQSSSSEQQKSELEKHYRFYLPLDFLGYQSPKQEILERVRLDFSNLNASWFLSKSELIPESQKKNYIAFLPELHAQKKLQKASLNQVVKNIFSRLGRDLGFLFGYLLLLCGTLYFIWRNYRK